VKQPIPHSVLAGRKWSEEGEVRELSLSSTLEEIKQRQ